MKMRYLAMVIGIGVLGAAAWHMAGGSEPRQIGLLTRSVIVGTSTREYLSYVPQDLQQAAPVVFVFHGGGGPWGSAELMYERSGWRDKAEDKKFVVIFAQGTLQDSRKPVNLADIGEPARNIRSWSDGSGITPASRYAIDDVAYVRAILADVEREYGIDESRIFATGFSNGATFAYYLGVRMSDTFAAIAPIAGLLYAEEKPSTPVSLLAVFGDTDKIPEKAANEALIPDPVARWAQHLGCTERTSPKGPSFSCPEGEVARLVVQGMGHEYATEVESTIWDFFSRNPKKGPLP
jgi:polyhydroxybutyrate depolymerase